MKLRGKLVTLSLGIVFTSSVLYSVASTIQKKKQFQEDAGQRLKDSSAGVSRQVTAIVVENREYFERLTNSRTQGEIAKTAIEFSGVASPNLTNFKNTILNMALSLKLNSFALYYSVGDNPSIRSLQFLFNKQLDGLISVRDAGAIDEGSIPIGDLDLGMGFGDEESNSEPEGENTQSEEGGLVYVLEKLNTSGYFEQKDLESHGMEYPDEYIDDKRQHYFKVSQDGINLISNLTYVYPWEKGSDGKEFFLGNFVFEKSVSKDFITKISQEFGVTLHLYDLDGKLAWSDSDERNFTPGDENKSLKFGQLEFFENRIEYSSPITIDENTIGYLTTSMSTESMNQKIRESNLLTLYLTIAILVLISIVSFIVVNSITNPLKILTHAVNQMSEGDFEVRADIKTKDEIGTIGKNFNLMVEKIKKSYDDLQIANDIIKKQNANLEHQVHEKTKNIKAILMNIQQGIFTIDSNLKIEKDFSFFLIDLFGTDQIEGKYYADILFPDKELIGKNDYDQQETVISGSIGEDTLNFELNEHLLLNEVKYVNHQNETKILELEWTAMEDDAEEIVEKVMVTVRDVTILRELQEEAEWQKKELKIIGEILSVSKENFDTFIVSSEKYIVDSRQILENIDQNVLDGISIIFRNMHTIKGNARVFSFHSIVDFVHIAEQSYQDLRDQNTNYLNAEQKEKLEAELQSVENMLEEYKNTYEMKLKRFGEVEGQVIDSIYFEKLKDVVRESATQKDSDDLVHISKKMVASVGKKRFGKMISTVVKSISGLAESLNKPVPVISLIDNEVLVPSEYHSIFSDVFMHIFRNSIDHGLETTEERKASSKDLVPRIELVLDEPNDDLIRIRFKDDGKGLNIKSIQDKAFSTGLLDKNKSYSTVEIANCIFESGLSTSKELSTVSGRGVGMDAVKSFIEEIGGSIEIKILGQNSKNEDYYDFQYEILIPSQFKVA